MIWIAMASGAMCRTTARCGRRTMKIPTGLLTAMATGFGNLIMDGPGSITRHGDGRLITTVAGSNMAARGDGGRASAEFVPFGRQLTYLFLIMAMTSIPSDGWPSGRAIHFSRGMAEADLVLVSSGSAISIAFGISIDSAIE